MKRNVIAIESERMDIKSLWLKNVYYFNGYPGSSDTTVKLWKGKTCLHTFSGHSGLFSLLYPYPIPIYWVCCQGLDIYLLAYLWTWFCFDTSSVCELLLSSCDSFLYSRSFMQRIGSEKNGGLNCFQFLLTEVFASLVEILVPNLQTRDTWLEARFSLTDMLPNHACAEKWSEFSSIMTRYKKREGWKLLEEKVVKVDLKDQNITENVTLIGVEECNLHIEVRLECCHMFRTFPSPFVTFLVLFLF